MNPKENNTPTTLVLKETHLEDIIFRKLSKEEVTTIREGIVKYSQFTGRFNNESKRAEMDKQLRTSYPFSYSQIIALGDTNLTADFARKHIEHIHAHTPNYDGHSFKCFQNDDWNIIHETVHEVLHMDALSAWNCALQRLNNPEFGLIYRVSYENGKNRISSEAGVAAEGSSK